MKKPMTSCAFCRHLRMTNDWPPKCKAYPAGIPEEIASANAKPACQKEAPCFEPNLLGVWTDNIKKEART